MSRQSKSNFKVQGTDFNDLNEGVEYEFVLKDKNVLDQQDDELDEIENALLKDFRKKIKSSSDSFDLNKKEILPQYGEEKDVGFIITNENEPDEDALVNKASREELNKIKEKFKLLKGKKELGKDNAGIINSQSSSNINTDNTNISNATKAASLKKLSSDLRMEKKFTSDYMTQEEFNSKSKEFKKAKIQPKKRIKAISTEEKEDMEENIPIPSNETNLTETNQIYDEYDELNFYLEKQRNLIIKENSNIRPEEKIKDIITSNHNTNGLRVEASLPSETVEYISDTTEFLKKVATKKETDENYKMITSATPMSLKDMKSGTHSVVNIPLPTDRLKYGASSVSSLIKSNDEEMKFLQHKRKPSESLADDESKSEATALEEAEVSPVIENALDGYAEPLVGKGIGVALAVLRKRGLVGKKVMWGRFKDKTHTTNDMFLKKEETGAVDKKKKPDYFKKEFNRDIELEYRDDKGRLLTPKEMYRYQSYIFHGKGPSKNKIEKRLLREQQEEKIQNRDASQSSKTFQYLKKMQQKMNTPFVVLQGKNTSLP